MRLSEIAEKIGARLEGDGAIEIRRVARLEDAEPGDLSFLANPKYASAVRTTRASAIILGEKDEAGSGARLRTANPYLAFAKAAALFAPLPAAAPGVHHTADLAADVTLGADASIGAFVSIGPGAVIGARTIVFPHVTIGAGARLGDDCVVHARVSIRERVQIGSRVVVQDGAVLGSDGFGFAHDADGMHVKIPQVGGLVIEDDVEIGANTTVDRPALGETRIRAGAKIDNLVQIAHGVDIGRGALLAAQVGVAGSTVIEDRVTLAGQVGVAGHLRIGKGVVATAQTGIPNSVDPGSFISGYPAIDNREWLKSSVVFKRLPELKRIVADLQRRLEALERGAAE